ASSGTICPATDAVDAICGATIPSGIPDPNSLRLLQYCLSSPYDTNEVITAPTPGTTPNAVPRIVLRKIVFLSPQISRHEGKRVCTFLEEAVSLSIFSVRPKRVNTSPRP